MLQEITKNNMTPEQFTYWLQGFVEISGSRPTDKEWQTIKDHIQTVFKKETPEYTFTTTTPDTSDGGFSIPNGTTIC